MSTPTQRLAELGLTLPPVAKPLAAYTPAITVGNQVWVSGQLPLRDGKLVATGRLGDAVEPAEGAEAAKVAALNALAAVADQAGGLDNVARILKAVVFVASTTDFTAQPQVANGASELLGEVFGTPHVRSAVGVAVLPIDAPVEVELVAELAAKVTAALIGSRLAAAYPDARCDLDHRSPFELLVAVVLSAQTTDARVNQVTPELFARYPDAEHLAEAEQDDVAEIISSLGLYRSKARSLTGLARALVADHDGRVPDSLDELVKLPGVGRKTANVVLGDAFGIPGITPDTHVIRVSNRLGWVHSTKPDDVERAVGALFPPGEWVVLCHRIIWHGRRCCRARTPACTACPVEDLCPSSQA